MGCKWTSVTLAFVSDSIIWFRWANGPQPLTHYTLWFHYHAAERDTERKIGGLKNKKAMGGGAQLIENVKNVGVLSCYAMKMDMWMSKQETCNDHM